MMESLTSSCTCAGAAAHDEATLRVTTEFSPVDPPVFESHSSSDDTEPVSPSNTPTIQSEVFSPLTDVERPIEATEHNDESNNAEDWDNDINKPVEAVEYDNECYSAVSQPAENWNHEQSVGGSAWVRYRREWCDHITGKVIRYDHSTTPLTDIEGLEENEEDTESPIFDVVTKATVINTDGNGASNQAEATGSGPKRCIRIYSVAIINALQRVVEYYPDQNLNSHVLEINWPYPILVHHYDELQKFKEDLQDKHPTELCMREHNAVEHISLLLRFLDDNVMESVREEEELIRNGSATFENYWLLYRPGATFLAKLRNADFWEAYVVHSVTGGNFVSPPTDWTIECWQLDYDGMYIGRRRTTIEFARWDGVVPYTGYMRIIHDWDDETEDEVIQQLAEWGKAYWSFIKNTCRYHKGKAMTFPHNEIEATVVTDMDNYYLEHEDKKPILMDKEDCRIYISDCHCPVCKVQRSGSSMDNKAKGKFDEYNQMEPKKRDSYGTTHKFALLPFQIQAFVFKTRAWETLHLRNFHEPNFEDDMINNLVMEPSRIRTLKALAKSFMRENVDGVKIEGEPWTADFVQGKGNGLIFLLHGSPGVGKTYTAEAIAQHTRRPLMVLTSSDIGIEAASVEENLMNNFKKAKRWGAVLLIDEADIFMERRKGTDLERNTLVAGFLRALEYYDGILFLTTNRVGVFDDAFISRIHIQLYYKEFTNEDRQKVWKTFMDKLGKERSKTMRVTYDAKEYIKRNEDLKAVKWNGREIRNAFQTAVSLAEYANERDEDDKIKLTDEHLREVVELSKDFKDYLFKLHNRDEAKRAEVWKERAYMER